MIPLAAALGLWAPAAVAADCEGQPGASTLTVQVSGVRAARGQVAMTVYPDMATRFLAPGGKLARVRPKAQAPVTSACFNLARPGYYAVAVYHDADADSDFDRTVVGLPAEGFGFSNDPPTPAALPPLRAVRFPVGPGDNTIRIRLRYLR
ncbi:DUF2141 domain-containing protein [Phenylobacterium sp.]|uniref:DUF2141 domain-containing protein n=1 Tax=Phenylobacterium sp. TaxID=1871053 RepID=UPI0039830693